MLGNLTGRPPYPGRVCHCLRSRHPPSREPLRAHRPVAPCASGSARSGHGPWRDRVEHGGRVHTTPQRSPLGPLGPAPLAPPAPGPRPLARPQDKHVLQQYLVPEKAPGTHGFPLRTSAVGRGGEAGRSEAGTVAPTCASKGPGRRASWCCPAPAWWAEQVEAAGGAGGAAGARRRRTCRHITLAGRLGQGGAEQVCQRGAL